MTELDRKAAELLLGNATDFLNGALEIIFKKDVTPQDMKIAILSIQTCFELLAKYRLTREKGLASIIRGNPPLKDLLRESSEGKIRTITFSESLQRIQELEPFPEYERDMIAEVQNTRNALAHFAAAIDVADYFDKCMWLSVRALSIFAAGADRDLGEMQNHISFLTVENFNRLKSCEQYRVEAVDAALDNIDTENVFRCWECLEDALALRPSETYFCYCCGLTSISDSVGFANCPKCKAERGVCFDALNDQGGGRYHGKCLHCNEIMLVDDWTDFGEIHSRHK